MTHQPMIVHCGKCSHEWAPCFLPAPADVVAKIAKHPCPVCGDKHILMGPVMRETPDGDPIAWVTSGDTGSSSLTIWSVMMGRRVGQAHGERFWPDVPYDPDDFGRCYRLLKKMPTWRERLPEVAERYPKWKALVEHWDEIEQLYLKELPSGRAPKCYALMRKCRREAA